MCPVDHDAQPDAPTPSSSTPDTSNVPDVDAPDELFKLLSDAHCHIHDDVENIPNISHISKTGRLLLMGVDPGDWEDVQRAAELNNGKNEGSVDQIVPAFGCHPWYAFCVSSSGTEYGVSDGVEDIFELKVPGEGDEEGMKAADEQKQLAMKILKEDLVPFDVWTSRLRSLLLSHPSSLVGEIGLDKNATVRGTPGLRVNPTHQLAVARKQLELAAELGRPVSFHLVNRSGWFLDLMRNFIVSADDLNNTDGEMPDGKKKKRSKAPVASGNLAKKLNKPLQIRNPIWTGPPAVCLHSYSGSVALIDSLKALPGGAGKAFYFSHSIVINAKSPSFEERIAATPDDRLLIESDYDRPSMVDPMVLEMCRVVARVKGWSLEEAARRTRENLERFLGTQGLKMDSERA